MFSNITKNKNRYNWNTGRNRFRSLRLGECTFPLENYGISRKTAPKFNFWYKKYTKGMNYGKFLT